MNRQIRWENEPSARYPSTIPICASIITVRLARDNITAPTPKLVTAVADGVGLENDPEEGVE